MKKQILSTISYCIVVALLLSLGSCGTDQEPHILVFSKTEGFRHESIPAGIAAIQKIGVEKGYIVDSTEDASLFTEENLSQYHTVIFLNTTGDILDANQQIDFQRFIQAGGGFVGIHSATDTEYTWPWYNKLVGAYFLSHPNNPNVRTADFDAVDHDHPSMDSMPDRFTATDEFYNFKSLQLDLIKPLVKIDESSYEGGEKNGNHPMSWYHEFDGGRAFYTALGHTDEMYENPLFVNHIKGAIHWALGGDQLTQLDYSKATKQRPPDENRFTKVVLEDNLFEPIELAVLPDERILYIQRRGGVRLYYPEDQMSEEIYRFDVSHKYNNRKKEEDEAEDGLLGLAIDPNFEENGWVYFYHSLAGDRPVNVLTRWVLDGDQLNEESMVTMLEIEVQREECCHTGGSITFDAQGNLYLSTGDNTNPFDTRYAPIDEREGRYPWDAQKSSANPNDLRGKILRITPQADGSYTIPEGNLFAPGTPGTRPEILGMGMRNPYRISVDQKTGYVYWGDVGPDAGEPKDGQGPAGHDEVNQLREPGFFGWPLFVADNKAYFDRDFTEEAGTTQFDPARPINDSPNNTGMQELPPAQPAFIYYPYGPSEEFPIVGTGGRNAMAGPVFYSDMFSGAERAFPDYYDGKLFIYDWMRGWIIAVTMDAEGDLVELEKFMPSYKFSNPMDMEFGPSGDLYMLEYGTGWFQQNENARLIKIEYNGGNRQPVIDLKTEKTKGAVPFTASLTAAESYDYDHDDLQYVWTITDEDDKTVATYQTADIEHTFDKVGRYTAQLELKDGKGGQSSQKITIMAGNEPPSLEIGMGQTNSMFFFPDRQINYDIKVSDREDGEIPDDEVAVTFDFLKEGYDQIEAAQGHVSADEISAYAAGKNLIAQSDCASCHKVDTKSVGPMYIDIAQKYKDVPKSGDYLISKIINGGNGVWGEVAMAAHPDLSVSDAAKMVSYIMSLAEGQDGPQVPLQGSYTVSSKDMIPGKGSVIIRAAYEDKGANGMPSIKSQEVIILNAPYLDLHSNIAEEDVNKMTYEGMDLIMATSHGGHVGYDEIDFTGVGAISVSASAPQQMGFVGGKVVVRIDSPDGPIVGESPMIKPGAFIPGAMPPSYDIPVKGVSGNHKVYFTFENESATANLFTIVGIGLKPS